MFKPVTRRPASFMTATVMYIHISRFIPYRFRSGFTLIEIMIAVAVFGLLSGFAVHGVRRAITAGRTSTARQDLARLAGAIDRIAWDTGKWPDEQDITVRPSPKTPRLTDLSILTFSSDQITSAGLDYPNWRGPYIDIIPLDPWNAPYFFDPAYPVQGPGHSSRQPVVGSFGPSRNRTDRFSQVHVLHNLEHIYQRTR